MAATEPTTTTTTTTTIATGDWGFGNAPRFTSKIHTQVHPAIDPAAAAARHQQHHRRRPPLPRPFVVCVVGASQAIIGRGVAEAYARAGGLAARAGTAASCRSIVGPSSAGIDIDVVACDIASADSVAGLADAVQQHARGGDGGEGGGEGGRLDVVVLASGYSGPCEPDLLRTAPETFQRASDVNYVGTFLCARYLPGATPTSSDTDADADAGGGPRPVPAPAVFRRGYCVAKMAQLKLVEHLHEEYHHHQGGGGLNAFSVHPGGRGE
ncbi:hypothetical protein F4778DRAFT_786332 [Xylariomycetidae sp. FL2044]|nr:hypothetical protein F4778DRAFT_786332 [Xylariomycetidae sp. FL2044]